MAIVINGKTYRNLQEQVKKNMDDIEELQNSAIDPEGFVTIDTDQTITGEKTFDANINIINGHDIVASSSTAYFGSIYENDHDISDVYATKDDVYTKAEADLTFADADDVYTKSEVDEMNSDMEDYIDDKIDKVNAIIGDGYISQLTATFGTSGNYKSVLNLGNLVESADYEDNGTNNTQFKENRSLYVSVEKGSIITLVGYPDYSSYKIITNETTYDNLTGTTTITALSTQVVEIKSLSNSNYYISLNITNYIKETLTDAIDDLSTKAIQKNADGNISEKLYLVNGISSADGEETDNKATISLSSGVRRSILTLNAGGEDGYANIELRGGTSGDGFVTITGDVTVDSIYRPKVGTGVNQEQVAYLSDIPASVSGVNNGSSWTSLTIGNDTYAIPSGANEVIANPTGTAGNPLNKIQIAGTNYYIPYTSVEVNNTISSGDSPLLSIEVDGDNYYVPHKYLAKVHLEKAGNFDFTILNVDFYYISNNNNNISTVSGIYNDALSKLTFSVSGGFAITTANPPGSFQRADYITLNSNNIVVTGYYATEPFTGDFNLSRNTITITDSDTISVTKIEL